MGIFEKIKNTLQKNNVKAPSFDPSTLSNMPSVKEHCRLRDIHAIQFIPGYISHSDGSYYSYELNSVLRDGGRLNVVDHGKQTKIRSDAQTLSKFLDVPVWDASYYK